MHLMKLAVLALSTTLLQATPAEKDLSFGQRISSRLTHTKEQVKSWLAPALIFVSDDSVEAAIKRLQYAHRVDHLIRRVVWVCTGHMPIKNPDGRIHLEEYVNYYLYYKALIKFVASNKSIDSVTWEEVLNELTDEEIIAAREEAVELLEEYRSLKGIRVNR